MRHYLKSAHIKTQPAVVGSSKLVPFEIQQTLRSRNEPVCVISPPVGLGHSRNRILIFTTSVGKFVMSLKPQVLRLIKHRVNPNLLQTDESGSAAKHLHADTNPASLECKTKVFSIALACSISAIRQLHTTSCVFLSKLFTCFWSEASTHIVSKLPFPHSECILYNLRQSCSEIKHNKRGGIYLVSRSRRSGRDTMCMNTHSSSQHPQSILVFGKTLPFHSSSQICKRCFLRVRISILVDML